LDWRGASPRARHQLLVEDAFAKRLYADLQNTGVRCWFAPHDLPIGAKTWDAIDAAIRVRDKVLLIFRRTRSPATGWKTSKAFDEERRRNQLVLFPVCIDNGDEDRRAVGQQAPRPAEYRRLSPDGKTTMPTSRRSTGSCAT
jgi:hypothetical protein